MPDFSLSTYVLLSILGVVAAPPVLTQVAVWLGEVRRSWTHLVSAITHK